MAGWVVLAVLLVVVALILVLLEALVPSGGLLTVLALLSGGGGIVLAFLKVESPALGFILLVGGLVLAPVAFLYGLSRLPHSHLGGRIVLRRPKHHGWTRTPAERDHRSLLGKEGVAISDLRPAGIAEFDGQRWDVVTEGPLLPSRTRVRVIAVEGNRVVVRAVEGEGTETVEGMRS